MMVEESDHERDLSVPLSRALDEIGLNESTVKERKDLFLYKEELNVIVASLTKGPYAVYYFGSQSEGTTIPGLDSDFDCLFCYYDYVVIQDLSDWTRDKTNLHMLQENTAPGYCKLQQLKRDKPEPELKPPDHERFVYENRGGDEMKGKDSTTFQSIRPDHQTNSLAQPTSIPPMLGETANEYTCSSSLKRVVKSNDSRLRRRVKPVSQMNGPAKTLSFQGMLVDTVIAFICSPNFKVAETWSKRHRRGDWPPQYLIQQVVNEPAFVVPVGHKLSQTTELEWRISTSLAERDLMFSLNIVQIKCYVLMKILVKEFVAPFMDEECLSSFHCKTVLFYCLEDTDTDFWREDNLLDCVIRCLRMLHGWVSDGICPSYILTGVNLFDGKVTQQNKFRLALRLKTLIQNAWVFLMNVTVGGLGNLLQRNQETSQNFPILDSVATMEVLAKSELYKDQSLVAHTVVLQRYTLSQGQETSIQVVQKILSKLRSCLRTCINNDLKRHMIGQLIETMTRYRGSLLAAKALSSNNKIEQGVLDLLRTGATHEISAKLKLASVFYCSGDLQKAEQLLQEIEQHVNSSVLQPVCGCEFTVLADGNKRSPLCNIVDKATRDKLVLAFCITFNSHEIDCVPLALHYELYSYVSDGIKRHPMLVAEPEHIAVDFLPFLYFLQYIMYRKIGKNKQKSAARRNLGESTWPYARKITWHSDIAGNLLGQCYEMEQLPPDAALNCYRWSGNNASKWLAALLLYKCIQKQS